MRLGPLAQLVVPAVVALVGASACAIFGANLPPGSAGGGFTEPPTQLPTLSSNMRARRAALDAAESQRIDGHFELLQELIRSSSALREQARRSQRRLEVSFLEDHRVSALDRELVLEGAHWFIELDLLLYNLWTTYRAYLPYASEPDPYAPVRGASLLSDDTRTKGGLVALVAEIVRLDNARVVMKMFEGQWAMTQFLNGGDEERGIEPESFDRLVGAYFDPDHRALLRSQLELVHDAQKKLGPLAAKDGELAILLAMLDESVVARELLEETGLWRRTRYAWAVASRTGVALLSPFLNTYIATVLVDEEIDPAALRRLSSVSGVADDLLDVLEPLDVLMLRDATRSPAGQGYTHAVLYLGDYSRLKDGPAKDHVGLVLNKADLRRGRVFVDISARGVELVDLDDVLEAQDVAVMRYDTEPLEKERELMRAFDALVARRFLTPPRLEQREHSARLLAFVLAESLDARDAPGRQAPPLSIIIADALNDPEVRVLFSTLDGAVQPEPARRRAVETLIEREGPLDVAVPAGGLP